jgi:hypothetical protein
MAHDKSISVTLLQFQNGLATEWLSVWSIRYGSQLTRREVTFSLKFLLLKGHIDISISFRLLEAASLSLLSVLVFLSTQSKLL